MAELNIGYEALVSCHEKLVSEIAQDPEQMAITLFQHRFIFEDTKAKINELDRTRRYKAILLVDDIENKVKCYPEFYEKFLFILGENNYKWLYCDLLKLLQEEYEKIEHKSKDGYESYPLSLLQPFPIPSRIAMADETDLDILELPTMDDGDGGTLPDPLEHPPDDTEVGADLRAAATHRQKAPTVDSFEGRLLQAFQSGEFEQVIELLSQAESQSIDLRGVSDADGKTLLHLACRKYWVDSYQIVCSLVDKHHCDVAAVDEDGNTPLHEAYQCGNLPIVAYLLSLPSCNPDAINKYEYTVLRMALETTDKPTARDLLATGRVDPRKGSSRGHSYSELLAMNHLQPQPQDYDGSALQMVIQFAECMEGSNHVRQPFTSYCLRDTLHKILKNRDQISIGGIVDRIKENMLPLPANPDEIHALLIDIQRLSDEFDVHGEYTNEVQVRYMPLNYGSYPESLLQPFPMPASTVTADEPDSAGIPGFSTVDNRGTLSNPLVHPPDYAEVVGVNLRAAATSRQEAPTGEEYVSRNSLSADSTIEDQETPDHYSYASDELPPSRRRALTQRLRRDETKPKYIKFGILFISFCCGFVVFLILGICGVVLYDGYSFISTTSVVQIDRQSVPLIVIHDLPTDLVRLTEFGTDFVPISFYTLRDCSSNDSFINVEINETITVNFSSPTDKTKAVTELYLARNTTVTVAITTVVLSNYETNHCVAFLFVFDNFDKFLSFTLSSFLVKEFYYKECIVNEQLQNMNITFDKPSYYYIGVYTDIPTEATTFSLHFVGTYLQYDISNKDAVCTIDSRDDLNCDFFPDYNNQQTCIVGFVPPISTDTPSEVTVSFYMYVGKYWETSIDSSFFTPLVLFIMLFLVLAYCLCTRKTE